MTKNSRGTLMLSIGLGLTGAALAVASAGLDLLGAGTPGLGIAQIAGIAVGLGLVVTAHGLARRGDGFGFEDVPWILGVLSVFAVAVIIVLGPRAPATGGAAGGDVSIRERLIALERTGRVPRRGPARCYPPRPEAPLSVSLEPVVDGLRKPVHVTAAGDGTRRLFIVEKGGTIRVMRNGRLLADPFLDIRERVVSDDRPPASWEQGLLSVAFPPDYADSGRFYVHYTAVPEGTVTISRFRTGDDPDRADPASEEIVLAVPTAGPIHNGGQLQFGPDGMLYVSIGDGGGEIWPDGNRDVYGDGLVEYAEDGTPIIPPGSGFEAEDLRGDDPWNQAQDPRTLRGAILRIDVDADSGYVIPPDNPFAGESTTDAPADARPEIWAYGLRNPWRFSIDDCDGALFVGDVGRSWYEEIDLVEPGGNYGWNVTEGAHCYPPWMRQSCDTRGFTFPIAEYRHLDRDPRGGNAVTGGYVYRGQRIPSLVGRYVFADFMSSRMWTLTPTGRSASGWHMEELMTVPFMPSSFGLDADGELLVAGYDGSIHRLVPGPPVATGAPSPER